MKKTLLAGLLSTLLFTTVATQSALAAKDVESSAIRLNDSYVLFQLTFDFGFLNRGAALSYLTNVNTASVNGLKYDIKNDNGTKMNIPTAGLVLSDSKEAVKNTYYTVAYGENENFTLLALATIPKVASSSYTLMVNELPYRTIDQAGAVSQASYPLSQMSNFAVVFSE